VPDIGADVRTLLRVLRAAPAVRSLLAPRLIADQCERLDCDVQSKISKLPPRRLFQARPGTVDIQRAANEVTRTQMITAAGGYGPAPAPSPVSPG